ncbi:MAG: type 4a pilus biogenesis protein PilO [Gammaproteobacteria bacterium]|nr:type 4a pilus biogenesis protein PilO [Gammaproteobacteria bacterium]
MTLDELKNINLNDISSLPLPVKILGVAVVGLLILALGYWFLIADKLEEKAKAQEQEQELRQTYLNKKLLALNIEIYRQQMEEMERTFGSLLRQLPNTTEVPDLLVDITQAGLGRGLEFSLFRPEKESPKDFYAELPISLQVSGSYHELAQFISDVAALPRIVTFGDITLSGEKGPRLSMTATARTYRYLDSGPPADATPKKSRTGNK